MTKTTITRRALLTSSAAALLAAPATIGYAQSQDSEGGIGGTGIVGVLTEFSSLIVGGYRVELDRGTEYTSAFGRITRQDIRVGDALTVEASGGSDGLVARRVHVTHPLVGRISRMTSDGRQLIVNGTRVIVEGDAVRLPVNARVSVAGVWRGTTVLASRVDSFSSGFDMVSGTVDRRVRQVRVGPVAIDGPGRGRLDEGGFATVLGSFDQETRKMTSTRTTAGRFTGAAGDLRRLAVEGYLEPTLEDPGFRISGLGHSFERNLDLSRFAGERVLFQGGYSGRMGVDRAVVLPDGLASRRRALNALAK